MYLLKYKLECAKMQNFFERGHKNIYRMVVTLHFHCPQKDIYSNNNKRSNLIIVIVKF